jgi:hypothetical protein
MRQLLKGSRYLLLLTIPIFSSLSGSGTTPDPSLQFIENKNQWSSDIHFAARIPGGSMMIGAGKFAYLFTDGDKMHELHERSHTEGEPDGADDQMIRKHSVLVDFIGANKNVLPAPFGRSFSYHNFYIGDDQSAWASRAYAYDGFLYSSLYEKINLKVYSSGDNLKYDFIVAPYGDPSLINIQYKGAESLLIDNGNLIVKTSLADLIEQRPIAYQFINGEKILVACAYELQGDKLSFCFPEGYDPCYELIVDPLLIFSTYSGSTADNWGSTATPGERGTLYSAGVTNQLTFGGTFPATAGAFQTSYGGQYDIGILKYDSAGRNLLYATFLGGASSESPHSLVVNKEEELIVLGTTSSLNFPTSANAFDRSFNGGTGVAHVVQYPNGSDIFVSRISGDGGQMLASTLFGGPANDGLGNGNGTLVKNYGDHLRGDVIADTLGNIYISSVTASAGLPVVNGYDNTYNGGLTDALILKFAPDLSALVWGTYLGGTAVDACYSIKLDSELNVYVAGGTSSLDFPMMPGGYSVVPLTNTDGWIAKIHRSGASLLNTTFTGTPSYDQVYFIDLNAKGDVYAYGQTNGGGTFPITPASVYRNSNSGQFLQKFDNSLSTLFFSTVFGSQRGVPDISPTAFLVNECNNIYMSGWGGIVNRDNGFWPNDTQNMPVSSDAYQPTTSGSDFYFIVLTDNATRFLYGTYLGGTQSGTHVDGGTSRFDKGGIVYHAVCSGCRYFNSANKPTSDFPTTRNAWSNINRSQNCNNAAFKFDLASLKARVQTNSEKRNNPGLTFVCMPDKVLLQNFSTGGEIFEWDLGDGTEITKTDTSAVLHKYNATGQYTVKLKAIDQNTCKAIDSTSTVVTVFKIKATAQDDDQLCAGSSYKLQAQGGILYEWKTDEQLISRDARPQVTPTDTTSYFVTIVDANGCVLKDTVQINVIPDVHPEFEMATLTDCFNRPYVRVSSTTDSLKAEDILFFDYGDGGTSDRSEDEHHYENDGAYLVKLVSARHGCVFEKVENVPIYTVKIPNIITPGLAEGANDRLTITYGSENTTPADVDLKVSLIIYNRWGRILLDTEDYQYDWMGEGLAAGVYYYKVTVQNHPTCRSWLQLVK